jgi:hypothetical protein
MLNAAFDAWREVFQNTVITPRYAVSGWEPRMLIREYVGVSPALVQG